MSRIDSNSSFRVQGEVISIAELAKTRPSLILAADDPRAEEFKARMAEIQSVLRREMPGESAPRRAEANPSQGEAPVAPAAKPEVTGTQPNQAFSSLDWELARSRMTFDALLNK